MAKPPSRRATPHLILASGSPRRRELLGKAGYRFEIVAPAVTEILADWVTIRETTAWNAMRKAAEVARINPGAVILGADTLVALDGVVIGKPSNLIDATRILRLLSGRTHEVWTSVFICQLESKKTLNFQELSLVRFRQLDDRAIANYLAKVSPLDKAGAYAAQGYGTEIIARIDGSYTNVVGLPMEETVRALRAFGVGVME
jgi:septum formation protein